MIYQILNILMPVILASSIGYAYAKYKKISMDIPNKINLDIFIPILIFYAISEKLPSIKVLGYFSIGAVIVVLGSGLILYPFLKYLNVNIKAFLPTMMFNNSINLGLPLSLFAFGQEAMAMFIALSLVQVIGQFTIAVYMYGGNIKVLELFKNPVIIATIFGLCFNYFDLHLPTLFLPSVEIISQVAIPLILFSLGVRLSTVSFKNLKVGLIGAVLCPLSGLIMAFFAMTIFEYTPLQINLLILFSILPPAVLNAILAEKYNHDSSMVASVVAVGTLASIIYIPVVLYFLLQN
ncbi:AEC family transporter [Halarcobacter sp.]|uniref:AEC family transporter n=1 Tax=Halarcobacter sp. TaxID=2321133 RepID=UPI002AA827A5|nr:AEC family transporter [Halarcobacter sp.]